RTLQRPAHHSRSRIAFTTGKRNRAHRGRTAAVGKRFPGHSDTGAHARSLRLALSPALPVHRRSPGMEPVSATAGLVAQLLLVLVEVADRISSPSRRLSLRVGSAGPRSARSSSRSGDAPANSGTGRTNARSG